MQVLVHGVKTIYMKVPLIELKKCGLHFLKCDWLFRKCDLLFEKCKSHFFLCSIVFLYYHGLLTIGGTRYGMPVLIIPNKVMYEVFKVLDS